MPKPQFTFMQISLIMLLSVGLLNHVIVIPVLLDVSRRDAWLSVLLAALLFLPAFYMIASIIRRSEAGQPLLSWLGSHYGKWLSAFIAAIVSLMLFLSAFVTGKDMTIWVSSSFLPQTPIPVITVTFVALCCFLADRGIRALVYSSSILLPLVVLFGEFVMTFNFSRKDYSSLFPIFEYGSMPMWRGVLYIGTGFLEMVYLLFMRQYLDRRFKKSSVFVLGLMLAMLTLGPVMGALAEFGPVEGALLRFPAFEEWRIVKIGNYIEHMDFLSIFQWMSGAFVRIGLAIYLITEIAFKGKRWASVLVAAFLTVCISIHVSDILFLFMLRTYYFPILFCSLIGVLCLVYVLVLIAPKSGGRQSNAS